MGRPRDMDPLTFDCELEMIEVRKPELPGLVNGLEGKALLPTDGNKGDEDDCALPAGSAGGTAD